MSPQFASRSRGPDYSAHEIIALLEWIAEDQNDAITVEACAQGTVLCAVRDGAASLRLPHWPVHEPTLVLEFRPDHIWARWDCDPLVGTRYEMLWEALQGEIYKV